ncbi:hypothetical protein [Ekhidna sp.]|uniref:hypothetical protein n=1 Tax=Ekhidna sp. TaxID=2608089 RepID=UPI003C7BEBB3
MKKLTLIIGLLVAVNILFAQNRREAVREKAEVKIEEYKERLNLTESQTADLKKLRESMKPELEAIRNDDSKSRSDKMRAKADIVEKQEKEVAKILNDEQLAELEVIKKEVRENVEKRRDRRKDRRGDGN